MDKVKTSQPVVERCSVNSLKICEAITKPKTPSTKGLTAGTSRSRRVNTLVTRGLDISTLIVTVYLLKRFFPLLNIG